MRLHFHFLIVGFCILGLTGCMSISPGFALDDDDVIVHIYSGSRFPKENGAFLRVFAVPFDDSAFDIGVGYEAKTDFNAVLSVFVYPSEGKSLESELSRVSSDIKEVTPEAHSIETWEVSWFDPPATGKAVLFAFEGDFFEKTANLLSELQLYAIGEWFVLVRMTTETNSRDQAVEEMEDLLPRITGPSY